MYRLALGFRLKAQKHRLWAQGLSRRGICERAHKWKVKSQSWRTVSTELTTKCHDPPPPREGGEGWEGEGIYELRGTSQFLDWVTEGKSWPTGPKWKPKSLPKVSQSGPKIEVPAASEKAYQKVLKKCVLLRCRILLGSTHAAARALFSRFQRLKQNNKKASKK